MERQITNALIISGTVKDVQEIIQNLIDKYGEETPVKAVIKQSGKEVLMLS